MKLGNIFAFKRLALFAALAFMPNLASAQAVWVDYNLSMQPGSEPKVVSAVQSYLGNNDKFEGIAILNNSMINGANPATHNFAYVFRDLASWERSRQAMDNSPERATFLRSMFGMGKPISETVYGHVAGWGLVPQENTQFIGFAMNVSNPKRYVQALNDYSQAPGNATEISGIDLWQVMAGGTPGVTHVAVISVKNRADFMKRYTDPAFSRFTRKFGQSRTVLGVSFSNNLSFSGPLDLGDIR